MDSSDVLTQRLHNQKLFSSTFNKPADVVRWFGAMQAQDFEGAKWAVGLRMRNATNEIIEKAYNQGKILRTHLLRPTWHFVAADDIRWLLELTAPRVNIKAGPNYRKYELDAATFKRSNRAFTNALRGGKHLTRRELRSVLNQSGVASDDSIRLVHILLRAELDAVICSGPIVNNQMTYALFDERVPATKALDRDEALAELTRRYFRSHGPATLQDFVWWSGLTVADARHGIALNDRDLKERVVEERAKPLAHILPAFDEYVVAYKDREPVVHPNDRKPSLTMQNLLGPIVIVEGRIAGTWKRTNDKNTATISLSPSRALTKSERLAIAKAVDRYAAFLGRPAQIV